MLQYRCVEMWAGQDDAYRQCLYNELKTTDAILVTGFDYHAQFVRKLRLYGRAAEADEYQRRLEQLAISIPPERLPASVHKLITPQTPAPLRRLWLNAWCAAFAAGSYRDNDMGHMTQPGNTVKNLATKCPPDELNTIARELADQWVAHAPRAVKSIWAKEFRQIFMLQRAIELYEYCGAAQQAADARAQIAALDGNDPAQQLATVVEQAYYDGLARRYAEVIAKLLPFYTPKPPAITTTSIDGMCHLANAYRYLNRGTELIAMLQQIDEALAADAIPAKNQVGFYRSLAEFTADVKLKAARLDRARLQARKAGYEALATRIDEEINLLALKDTNSEEQFAALIALTQQREAQREQLAFDPALRQQWFADNIGPYRKLLKMAAVRYHEAQYAFSLAEYMRARSLLDEMAWHKVDMGAYLPPDLQAQLTALRRERQETLGLYSSKAPVDGATLKAKLSALAKREAELTTAVRDKVPSYQFASAVAAIKPEELIARIQQDTSRALVEYTLVDDGLVVVAFHGARDPQVAFIPVNENILWEQIGHFREHIWKRDPQADQAASDLYALLLKPVEAMLTDAESLIVIADGAVQLLPFSALRDEKGRYLAERMPVLTAPSVSLLFTPRVTPSLVAENAVIFAAPNIGAIMKVGDDPRGLYMPIRGMIMPIRGAAAPARGAAGPDLPLMASIPLPGAQAEGDAIAKLLARPTLMTGAAATKAQLYTLSQHAAYLHIATHGFADPEMPTLSGVLLAGAKGQPFDILTAQEVFTWTLPAKLVTLSACQTAMGQDVAGEGVIGLTRAFLCAGAESVVSTLWPVADATTAQLMTAFYTDIAAGKPIAVALNAAQQRLLKNPATRAPYYWAGFTVIRGTWKE
jgi:CHAT domain-containing protein